MCGYRCFEWFLREGGGSSRLWIWLMCVKFIESKDTLLPLMFLVRSLFPANAWYGWSRKAIELDTTERMLQRMGEGDRRDSDGIVWEDERGGGGAWPTEKEQATMGKIIVLHENENYIMCTIKYTKRLPNRISNKKQTFWPWFTKVWICVRAYGRN